MKFNFQILLFSLFTTGWVSAQQSCYWQQKVDYQMEVEMNVKNYQYDGAQELTYTNNSPDTLTKVFYHLYFNAFQPGSQMDARLQDIQDPDGRMVNNLGTRENPNYESRISKLKEDEIGYLKVTSLKQNGKKLNYQTIGTVLEVQLNKPLLPGKSTQFSMDFEGQVPVQIRRSGRNNAEGVALSMTQWYPKLAEYDFEGWHADPYIAREFHGVWGDFDVKITIDKDYTLGGTGYLQNPEEIGHGYEEEGQKVKQKGRKLTWHFKAPNVHDFTWAADPNFIHDKLKAEDGTMLHFLYKDNDEYKDAWKKLQPKTAELLAYYNEHIGPYPYDQYSVIQGGDGGMEYAMCTLITGERNYESLVGVTAHEFAHSWFQFVLATNESQNEWMDEGFTTYISVLAEDKILNKNSDHPLSSSYRNYNYIANSGQEQPLTTHADRYRTNMNYGIGAYSKGSVFLAQLGYIIGEENLAKTLKRYFQEWKFKHPTPNDFIRVAEKVSGAELSWYLNDFTRTINTIDYAIKKVEAKGRNTEITLKRIGLMPMPIEVEVTFKDNSTQKYYIPLEMMRWEQSDNGKQLEDWGWGHPTYSFEIEKSKAGIKKIEVDSGQLMADIDRDNNVWEN